MYRQAWHSLLWQCTDKPDTDRPDALFCDNAQIGLTLLSMEFLFPFRFDFHWKVGGGAKKIGRVASPKSVPTLCTRFAALEVNLITFTLRWMGNFQGQQICYFHFCTPFLKAGINSLVKEFTHIGENFFLQGKPHFAWVLLFREANWN